LNLFVKQLSKNFVFQHKATLLAEILHSFRGMKQTGDKFEKRNYVAAEVVDV